MFMKIIKHWLTTYLLILFPVIAWCENEVDSNFNVSLVIDQLVIEPGGNFARIDGPKILVKEKGAYSFEIEFIFS